MLEVAEIGMNRSRFSLSVPAVPGKMIDCILQPVGKTGRIELVQHLAQPVPPASLEFEYAGIGVMIKTWTLQVAARGEAR